MSTDNNKPIDQGTLRLVIRDEVANLIHAHKLSCMFQLDDFPKRVRQIEQSNARLAGFMLGSGLISGATAAAVAKFIF